MENHNNVMTNRSQLKIIYLGSSVLDEAPIRHLVKNGHSVISTDINPYAYARESSSEFINVDSTDAKALYRSISKYIRNPSHELIVPSGERFIESSIDLAILMNPALAEVKESYKVFSNKWLQKELFSRKEIAYPQTFTVSKEQELDRYPYIVKPPSGWASKGIRVINNREEYDRYLEEYKIDSTDTLIAEEYCDGREITAGGFLFDKKYIPLFQYETTPFLENFQAEYVFTSKKLEDTCIREHRTISSLLRELNIENTILTANFISREPYLLEIAPVTSLGFINLCIKYLNWSPLTALAETLCSGETAKPTWKKSHIGFRQIFGSCELLTEINENKSKMHNIGDTYIIVLEMGNKKQKINKERPLGLIFSSANSKNELKKGLDDAYTMVTNRHS